MEGERNTEPLSPSPRLSPIRSRPLQAFFRCIAWLQQYFVEIALFAFFLGRHMSLPLFQEYVMSEVFKQHGVNLNEIPAANSSHDQKWHKANHESALIVLGLQVAEGLPAIVAVIILGAVSDRTGRRKILLWLPSLGGVAYNLIYILILYTNWNLDGLFMASALRGISGSMPAFLAGTTYFGINSVTPDQRSSRLSIQEFLNGGAYAVANVMVGFWVKDKGFLEPFWFALICSSISLLISFFLVQEFKMEGQPRRAPATGNLFRDTFAPMMKYFRCCENSSLIRIWLAILAFQTYAAVHIGQENTLVLYLSGQKYLYNWHPFSVDGEGPVGMTYVKIGLFLAVIMAMAAIATALVPSILKKFLSEAHISFIGFASKALGTLWIAVIRNENLLYFAILLLAFELLPFPMLRTLVSKRVAQADQGSVFALMHCGESITYFLAPFTFTAVYASSLHYYSGFVFIFSILLLLVPTTFTVILCYLETRQPTGYEPMEDEANPGAGQAANGLAQTEEQEQLSAEPISYIQLNDSAAQGQAV